MAKNMYLFQKNLIDCCSGCGSDCVASAGAPWYNGDLHVQSGRPSKVILLLLLLLCTVRETIPGDQIYILSEFTQTQYLKCKQTDLQPISREI